MSLLVVDGAVLGCGCMQNMDHACRTSVIDRFRAPGGIVWETSRLALVSDGCQMGDKWVSDEVLEAVSSPYRNSEPVMVTRFPPAK